MPALVCFEYFFTILKLYIVFSNFAIYKQKIRFVS